MPNNMEKPIPSRPPACDPGTPKEIQPNDAREEVLGDTRRGDHIRWMETLPTQQEEVAQPCGGDCPSAHQKALKLARRLDSDDVDEYAAALGELYDLLTRNEIPAAQPAQANHLRVVRGVCFKHGPYEGSACPKQEEGCELNGDLAPTPEAAATELPEPELPPIHPTDAERDATMQRERECRAALQRLSQVEKAMSRRRFAPIGDNHHNAAACPYCNPTGLTLKELIAQRDALHERTEELEKAQEGWVANAMGYKAQRDALQAKPDAIICAVDVEKAKEIVLSYFPGAIAEAWRDRWTIRISPQTTMGLGGTSDAAWVSFALGWASKKNAYNERAERAESQRDALQAKLDAILKLVDIAATVG